MKLCIGVDGHLEIEAEADDCCPSRLPLAAESSLAREAGSCASCIDVHLAGHEAGAFTPATGFSSDLGFPPPSLLERLNPLKVSLVIPDQGHPAAPRLAALRSVVLRV